jgi:hypothetical protein
MDIVILNSNSKTDLKLVLDIAKKIGIKATILNESEIEDIGLAKAIKQGKTGKYIDSKSFIKKLRK